MLVFASLRQSRPIVDQKGEREYREAKPDHQAYQNSSGKEGVDYEYIHDKLRDCSRGVSDLVLQLSKRPKRLMSDRHQ